MTDKQIIDGEQCQYLSDTGLCRLVYNLTEKSYERSMCKKNHNCYYKQLKKAINQIVDLNKKVEAIKAGLISEKDIDVPSKRLDRIDKMEIDLANYEQMERDIEKIIEPYQLDWELDCLSLPSAIQSILERKEQEYEAYKMEAEEGKEINAELKAENEKLDTENKRLVAELANPVFDSFEELDRLNEDRIEALKQLEFVRTLNTVQEAEIRKLSKTLTEIKEIIHFNKTNRLSGGADISIEQILQKISEVEDEHNG